ncbi:hypothetical protein PCI56_02240 [Plesiomonas shigelloides subsp. oncorhynchi]|nr:hypothetical protein [Plesiomonas shigelloides]
MFTTSIPTLVLEYFCKYGGTKERVCNLGCAEKEFMRHILVTVALADGKVSPGEIKQLEKLYTALGLDKTQVAADVHKLTSCKGSQLVTATINRSIQKQGFVLNDELLAFHASETDSVQSLLGTIFVDDMSDESQVVSQEKLIASDSAGLDQAHSALFKQLITQERWERKDVLAACESLKLMLDGAVETINDWAYEQVDAPVIDDDEDIYIDLEIANELNAG